MSTAFSVTWDYRCPFARNAHEHVLTALEGGADWDVRFTAFSLGPGPRQGGRSRPSGPSPTAIPGLLANLAGIVVRDRAARRLLAVCTGRCSRPATTRPSTCATATCWARPSPTPASTPSSCSTQIETGWPLQVFEAEHTAAVDRAPGLRRADLHLGDRLGVRAPDGPARRRRGQGHLVDRASPRPHRRIGPSSTSSSTRPSPADGRSWPRPDQSPLTPAWPLGLASASRCAGAKGGRRALADRRRHPARTRRQRRRHRPAGPGPQPAGRASRSRGHRPRGGPQWELLTARVARTEQLRLL